jgi:hypothetical protein
MKKEFYIIVPYDKEENQSVRNITLLWPLKNFFSWVFNNNVDKIKIKEQIRNFTSMKKWLISRTNMIKTWLENLWIRATELDKEELIKFLIDYYNPRLDNFTEIKNNISDFNI